MSLSFAQKAVVGMASRCGWFRFDQSIRNLVYSSVQLGWIFWFRISSCPQCSFSSWAVSPPSVWGNSGHGTYPWCHASPCHGSWSSSGILLCQHTTQLLEKIGECMYCAAWFLLFSTYQPRDLEDQFRILVRLSFGYPTLPMKVRAWWVLCKITWCYFTFSM